MAEIDLSHMGKTAEYYNLLHVYECPCRINRIHHWCSVETEKSIPEGPPFQSETRLAESPTGTVDPRVGIFLELFGIFLIYHDRTIQYCVIFVGDVTEIDVYSQ